MQDQCNAKLGHILFIFYLFVLLIFLHNLLSVKIESNTLRNFQSVVNKIHVSAGPLGFRECLRMPFRLIIALSTFQSLMDSSTGDLHLTYCLLYLDDIVVYSSTYKEYLVRLVIFIQRLRDRGLKLKPFKCYLFQHSITNLGHIILEEGCSYRP